MSPEALPYIILLGILFGSSLVVSRFSVGQFQPLTYIGLRLGLAGLAHIAVYVFSRSRQWPQGRTERSRYRRSCRRHDPRCPARRSL